MPDTAALEIESAFQHAITIAQQQQAKAPELRATMSLSRFWLRQGKGVQAYQPLNALYHWFREGFDTPDLQEAQQLLDTLRP